MLRIKNDVNLEILRDYEFLEEEEACGWKHCVDWGSVKSSVMILVDKTSRRVMVSTWDYELDGMLVDGVTERTTDPAMETLYKLITAGMIEIADNEQPKTN